MDTAVEVLGRIRRLFAAATIAHESVFEMHRELVSEGRDDAESRTLLKESSRIVLIEMPAIAAEAHRLAAWWGEERILNPGAAERTSHALEKELARIEPALRALLDRHKRLAIRLDRILDR